MADVKELNINSTTYDIKAKSVVNQNSGSIKFWTGTKSQYDAITTKDSNTLYNITDDTDVTLSLLNLLYPIGSIYIGTMATCPLATLGVGTWQLKATGLMKYNNNVSVYGSGSTVLWEGLPTDSSGDRRILGTAPTNTNSYGYIAPTNVASGSDNVKIGDTCVGSISSSNNFTTQKYIGVITKERLSKLNTTENDNYNSGLIADLSNLEISTNIWERTA